MNFPEIETLSTPADVLAVRASLPRLRAGDPRQAYKWALALRLRKLRINAAGRLSAELVRRLFSDAGDVCPECHQFMGHGANRSPSLDHIVAVANGGTNEESNLRIICNRCNSAKGERA